VTKLIHSNKEYKTMKKLALVLALAVVLTFALTAVAFADHSPSFYIQWNDNGGYSEANSSTPSPHAGYAEGTQKCAVCHAVHRAAVAGLGYATDAQRAAIGGDPAQGGIETQNPPDGSFPADAGGTNRAKRATYLVPDGENTQMLLQSDVAGACDYCHIETSVGGEQIYAGAVKYRLEADSASGGSDW
jgi:mono/diheme cytochrome c family protein